MLRISSLCSSILILFSACQEPNSAQEAARIPGEIILGGWAKSESQTSKGEAFVFLPIGKFEGENLLNLATGSWHLTSDSLVISSSNEDISLRFSWELENSHLVLSQEEDVIKLSRRSYGFNASLQFQRLQKITHEINRQLLQKRELLNEFQSEQGTNEQRVLGLWETNGLPIKLAVTEPVSNPNDFGGFSEFIFLDGYLMYFIGLNEMMAFERNQISACWTKDGELCIYSKQELFDKGSGILQELQECLLRYGIEITSGQFKKIGSAEDSEPSS